VALNKFTQEFHAYVWQWQAFALLPVWRTFRVPGAVALLMKARTCGYHQL
jgi:hypothetical protein